MNEETSLPESPVLDLPPDLTSEIRPKDAPFPPDFEGLVEESTENFKLALPVMLRTFATQQGWVEQYRTEIRRVILEVLKR